MIWGIGIDLIEIDRIEKALKNEAFIDKIFSNNEKSYCESRKGQKGQAYAVRFAAKEAFVKALGTGFRGGNWKDVEVVNNEWGKPQINVYGYFSDYMHVNEINVIHVSLTHTKTYAAANVLLAKE